MNLEGNILKMTSILNDPVDYFLPIGDESLPLNEIIGKKIKISYK